MVKRIFNIIIMTVILLCFLAFVNISAVNFAIDVFQSSIVAFILTCIVGGISLLFSDLFITYICILAIIDSIKETIQYKKDMKTIENLYTENDDKYDPHADYH